MNQEPLPAQGPVDVNVRPCDEPCAKCVATDIYRRFIAKGGKVPHEWYDKCASKYGTGQSNSWTATRDHLNHHCRCCGFAWQTLPMKKRKSGPKAEVSGCLRAPMPEGATRTAAGGPLDRPVGPVAGAHDHEHEEN